MQPANRQRAGAFASARERDGGDVHGVDRQTALGQEHRVATGPATYIERVAAAGKPMRARRQERARLDAFFVGAGLITGIPLGAIFRAHPHALASSLRNRALATATAIDPQQQRAARASSQAGNGQLPQRRQIEQRRQRQARPAGDEDGADLPRRARRSADFRVRMVGGCRA